MNTAWPRRVSLITSLDRPTILSPTIGATTGDRPAVRRFSSPPIARFTGFALRSKTRPSTPTESSSPRLPHRKPALRTGRSRSVALHPALRRRSYGSIPRDASPHGSGLAPLWPNALSGARPRTVPVRSTSVGTQLLGGCGRARFRGSLRTGTVRGPGLPKHRQLGDALGADHAPLDRGNTAAARRASPPRGGGAKVRGLLGDFTVVHVQTLPYSQARWVSRWALWCPMQGA